MARQPRVPMTAHEAISKAIEQLEQMRADKDRSQLAGVSPDDAFELGYEAAIFDFRILTDPSNKGLDSGAQTQTLP